MDFQGITFINEPKLSVHENDTDQNSRRLALLPKIAEYLSTHDLCKDKTVSVTFFQTGSSGLTSLIETQDTKFVLKILLRPDGPKGEADFLRIWESVGVVVPHVFESGMIEEHPYMLMSYIPALALEHISEQELLSNQIFKKMGEILRKIHTTRAEGFGRVMDAGKGEYEDFKTWILEYPQTKNQLSYIQKHDLLPASIFGSIEEAINLLVEYVEENNISTYCHWDFAPGNILYTDPLTIFDPVPIYNHPYLDIARSIIQTIGNGFTHPDVSVQFLDGYFSNSENKINKNVLQVALVFIAHTKIPHWHKTNEEKIVADVKKYLMENN